MCAGLVDQYSQLNLTPETIVVGLNQNRMYDPVTYGDFLEEELLPFIDSTYRTAPFHLLAGHFSSGQQALFDCFRGSGCFQGIIAGSPKGLEKYIPL